MVNNIRKFGAPKLSEKALGLLDHFAKEESVNPNYLVALFRVYLKDLARQKNPNLAGVPLGLFFEPSDESFYVADIQKNRYAVSSVEDLLAEGKNKKIVTVMQFSLAAKQAIMKEDLRSIAIANRLADILMPNDNGGGPGESIRKAA